ncbi:hypothetical protein ACFOY2_25195 [Nonomuraea purpurea]|uniref:Uncharacterized protein n=1 Tax=Nonomuraea purpurea TaxID=1849276 RepID=A0ABV8G983_9ACTN
MVTNGSFDYPPREVSAEAAAGFGDIALLDQTAQAAAKDDLKP